MSNSLHIYLRSARYTAVLKTCVISVGYSAVWAWANAVKLLVYAVYTLYTVVLYMQIYYCETQTSLQTRRAYTEVLRGPTICKSAKRKLANRKWVHIYGGSVHFFLPYMSSLRDNESRGERGGWTRGSRMLFVYPWWWWLMIIYQRRMKIMCKLIR